MSHVTHPYACLGFVLLLFVSATAELAAQRTVELIGRPTPSHTFVRPIAISGDGRTIALHAATAVRQGGFR